MAVTMKYKFNLLLILTLVLLQLSQQHGVSNSGAGAISGSFSSSSSSSHSSSYSSASSGSFSGDISSLNEINKGIKGLFGSLPQAGAAGIGTTDPKGNYGASGVSGSYSSNTGGSCSIGNKNCDSGASGVSGSNIGIKPVEEDKASIGGTSGSGQESYGGAGNIAGSTGSSYGIGSSGSFGVSGTGSYSKPIGGSTIGTYNVKPSEENKASIGGTSGSGQASYGTSFGVGSSGSVGTNSGAILKPVSYGTDTGITDNVKPIEEDKSPIGGTTGYGSSTGVSFGVGSAGSFDNSGAIGKPISGTYTPVSIIVKPVEEEKGSYDSTPSNTQGSYSGSGTGSSSITTSSGSYGGIKGSTVIEQPKASGTYGGPLVSGGSSGGFGGSYSGSFGLGGSTAGGSPSFIPTVTFPTSAGEGASGIYTGSKGPCCKGPFPGPKGSIHDYKPAIPVVPMSPPPIIRNPSYGGHLTPEAGNSNINTQGSIGGGGSYHSSSGSSGFGGSFSSSGSDGSSSCCKGPFPGPNGSIHDYRPATSVVPIPSHSIPALPSSSGHITTGSGVQGSVGGSYGTQGSIESGASTGYDGSYSGSISNNTPKVPCCKGPFPGPNGSIHQSIPVSSVGPIPSTGNSYTGGGVGSHSGSHYTGTLPIKHIVVVAKPHLDLHPPLPSGIHTKPIFDGYHPISSDFVFMGKTNLKTSGSPSAEGHLEEDKTIDVTGTLNKEKNQGYGGLLDTSMYHHKPINTGSYVIKEPGENTNGYATGTISVQKPDGTVSHGKGESASTGISGSLFTPNTGSGNSYSGSYGGSSSQSGNGYATGKVEIDKSGGFSGPVSGSYGSSNLGGGGSYGGSYSGSGSYAGAHAGSYGGAKSGSLANAGSTAGGFSGILGNLFGKQGLGGNLGASSAGSGSFASSSSFAGASSGAYSGHY